MMQLNNILQHQYVGNQELYAISLETKKAIALEAKKNDITGDEKSDLIGDKRSLDELPRKKKKKRKGKTLPIITLSQKNTILEYQMRQNDLVILPFHKVDITEMKNWQKQENAIGHHKLMSSKNEIIQWHSLVQECQKEAKLARMKKKWSMSDTDYFKYLETWKSKFHSWKQQTFFREKNNKRRKKMLPLLSLAQDNTILEYQMCQNDIIYLPFHKIDITDMLNWQKHENAIGHHKLISNKNKGMQWKVFVHECQQEAKLACANKEWSKSGTKYGKYLKVWKIAFHRWKKEIFSRQYAKSILFSQELKTIEEKKNKVTTSIDLALNIGIHVDSNVDNNICQDIKITNNNINSDTKTKNKT